MATVKKIVDENPKPDVKKKQPNEMAIREIMVQKNCTRSKAIDILSA